MKKYLLLLFGLLFYVTLPAQPVNDSRLKLVITNPLNPNLIKVTHIAGNSNGSVNATVINSTQLTGDNYLVFFTIDNQQLCWNLKNITKNILVASNRLVQDPIIVDGIYFEITSPPNGIKTDDINSTSDETKWGWDYRGTRRFTWINGDPNHYGFESFGNLPVEGGNGTIGYMSPDSLFNGITMLVKPNECKKVLLKLSYVNYTGDWGPTLNLNDPNVSYGYRYLRRANQEVAESRFAPFIINPIAGVYPFQAFEKNVPLSAWDIDDPSNPKRLMVGFLENNVVGGLVDGVYWPAFYNNITDNSGPGGPREWLFVMDEPYSEIVNTIYQQPIANSQARVMYTAVWNRKQNTAWSATSGTDQFFIYPNKPLSEADFYFIINTQSCANVDLAHGWNLISVPIQTNSMYTQNIFPDFVSQTYGFSNGLRAEDNLTLGKGYWLKYSTNKTISLCGQASGVITVPVNEGWNLIGGYNWNVNIPNVTSSPSSILTTPFYGYDNGYSVASQLEIGKGYWVKSSANGIINLNVGLLKSNDSFPRILVDDSWDKIILSNPNNEIITLFNNSGPSSENLSFELPPLPPKEIFDCRYSNNLLVENLSGGWKTIDIQSKSYPVKLRANGISVEVRENEREKCKVITKNQEFIVSNPAVKSIQIRTLELPSDYSLDQNYPNPFNPETVIKYQIPAISHVTLKVYDVLGRELVKLIDEIQQPGNYQATFNTHNLSLSSGVYFYRLQAGEFIQTKKMILTK